MNWLKKHGMTIVLVLILLAGFSLLLYPTISDWWNSFHSSRAIASYVEQVANIEEEDYEQMILDAREYNRSLLGKVNRWELTEEETAVYNSILDVSGTGIMGYVDIPSIDVSLPIYHGVDEGVLQIAVGHISGSSFPIGGIGNHAILSAHRGLPSARLFTDLDKLVEGDLFMVQVLDETLTYEVDQIRIVLPHVLEDLEIDPNQDYCTLVTCTPYGVNSHRMLVRGHRVATTISEESDVRVTADAVEVEPLLVAPFVAAPMLLILLIILLFKTRRKKR